MGMTRASKHCAWAALLVMAACAPKGQVVESGVAVPAEVERRADRSGPVDVDATEGDTNRASGVMAVESGLLEDLLRQRPEWFASVMDQVEHYEVQVLYTQIDRDAQNRPRFTSHWYGVDPETYFYPASTVKLAGAALALEKLNQLAVPGVDLHTAVRIDSAGEGQTEALEDASSRTGLPSIGHYIRKLFAVSDNDAYNRLYEFLGQEHLNERLRELGYSDVRLTHRLSVVLPPEQNRCTNPMSFRDGDRVLHEQPAVCTDRDYGFDGSIPKGVGKVQDGLSTDEPLEFAAKNYMSVEALQFLVRSVMFPEAVSEERRFDLRPGDYDFLRRCMSILPRECRYPQYDAEDHWDSYVKFFLFGDSKDPVPEHIRLFNKVGLAYGYLIDNAYVVDFEKGVEYLLTAVILVNEDGIYNSDVMAEESYPYEELGFPFLANLGRAIHEYELERPRERAPDLSAFEAYRQPADGMAW